MRRLFGIGLVGSVSCLHLVLSLFLYGSESYHLIRRVASTRHVNQRYFTCNTTPFLQRFTSIRPPRHRAADSTTIASDEECLIEAYSNGLSHIHIKRSRQHNALNSNILNRILTFVENERDVLRGTKVLLISGSGKSFCSGGDLKHCLTLVRAPTQIKEDISYNRRTSVLSTNVRSAADYLLLQYHVQQTLSELRNTYNVSVIAFGTGNIMGAGQGIYSAATHRLITTGNLKRFLLVAIDIHFCYIIVFVPYHYK